MSPEPIRRCATCGSWMGVDYAYLHWCHEVRDPVIDAILSEYAEAHPLIEAAPPSKKVGPPFPDSLDGITPA